MTGAIMRGDDDGYYYSTRNIGVGQNGSCVWFGFHPDGRWANVFSGRTVTEGQLIRGMKGDWCDIPWGNALGHGTISVGFATGGSWVRTEVSGGFGGRYWSPVTTRPEFPPLPTGRRDFPTRSLTGVWLTDTGAQYYIRELADGKVFWFAVRPDLAAAHVARGNRAEDNVSVNWLDIPPGSATSGGNLRVRVEAPGILRKVSSTAGFGSTRWIKLSA